jgi:hypothetical protein
VAHPPAAISESSLRLDVAQREPHGSLPLFAACRRGQKGTVANARLLRVGGYGGSARREAGTSRLRPGDLTSRRSMPNTDHK